MTRERGDKLLVARDYWCSKANTESFKICEKCTDNPKYKICCDKHNSWTILWLCFFLPFTCRKWWDQIQRRLILLLYTLLYPSGYHICLSSPKQPSWAVCWFSQEFVTCLIEHLSQIWALWCNILTLSDVRNTRVWNRIFWFWLVSFYLAKCLFNAMLYLFTGILRLLFWKPDFGGNLSKKVIESRYIGHFLIIGQIIVIDFTLP